MSDYSDFDEPSCCHTYCHCQKRSYSQEFEKRLLGNIKKKNLFSSNLTDFTVETEDGTEIAAFKLLLACSSTYFECLFRSNPSAKSVRLNFEGTKLKKIINTTWQFDEINLFSESVDNLLEYYMISDYLLMDDLTYGIGSRIIKHLRSFYKKNQMNTENFYKILEFVDCHDMKRMGNVEEAEFRSLIMDIICGQPLNLGQEPGPRLCPIDISKMSIASIKKLIEFKQCPFGRLGSEKEDFYGRNFFEEEAWSISGDFRKITVIKVKSGHFFAVKGLIIEMKEGRIFHFGIKMATRKSYNNANIDIKTFDVPKNTHINAVRGYHEEFIHDVQFTYSQEFPYEIETSLVSCFFRKSLVGLPGYEKCRLTGMSGAVVRGKIEMAQFMEGSSSYHLMDGNPFISKLEFTFECVE